MTSIDITLTFPDALARQAENEGLLDPEAIVKLIQAELERRQHVQSLFEAADRLASLDMPPLSEAEVEAEIQAVRNARHS
jgi:hypothetical protein